MIREDDSKIIEVVHFVCCGLDVHKDRVSACLLFMMTGAMNRARSKNLGPLRTI
jgi:hypothetical protein